MRGNYVDVMGANNKSASSSSNPPQAFAPMPQAPVTNFFVPASGQYLLTYKISELIKQKRAFNNNKILFS